MKILWNVLPYKKYREKGNYEKFPTRTWDTNSQGIKYYTCSTKYSKKDLENLKTVATYSITTVDQRPEKAVDNPFCVNSYRETEDMFRKILNKEAAQ